MKNELLDLRTELGQFALGNIFAQAFNVEGFRLHEDLMGGEQAIEIILPPITQDVLDEHWPDWREEFEREDPETSDAQYLADAIEQFESEDGFWEWQDQFAPMMNFIWPVQLAYGVSPEQAAERIDRLAGSTSLVNYGEGFGANHEPKYGIVLTGGGMDLSDHIARAYMCCGTVPPLVLLRERYTVESMPQWARFAYKCALHDAQSHLHRVARQLVDYTDQTGELKA